jgi:hypothetical protein
VVTRGPPGDLSGVSLLRRPCACRHCKPTRRPTRRAAGTHPAHHRPTRRAAGNPPSAPPTYPASCGNPPSAPPTYPATYLANRTTPPCPLRIDFQDHHMLPQGPPQPAGAVPCYKLTGTRCLQVPQAPLYTHDPSRLWLHLQASLTTLYTLLAPASYPYQCLWLALTISAATA